MTDITSKVEAAFEKMKGEYEAFFKVFYPGKASAGFNESNLVCKFASNYKIINENSIYWNELSTGKYKKDINDKEKVGRIDGVILDLESQAAIFIEAKRINHPDKLKLLAADFDRLSLLRGQLIDGNSGFSNHYILLLADIWDEARNKKERWTEKWTKDNPIYDILSDKTAISTMEHQILSFSECTNISAAIKEKYNLCYSLYKIN